MRPTPGASLVLMLLTLGCLPRRAPDALPSEAPQVSLGAQASLSVDYSTGRAHLTVHTLLPDRRPRPEDRNGVPVDACRRTSPVRATVGMVLKPAEVSARCGGEAVSLEEMSPGAYRYSFAQPPEPSLKCEITIDGERFELPPLPTPPDVALRLGRLRWTPAGGDELRFVVPDSAGYSTVCRLLDDGEAAAPAGAGLHQAFVTRHLYGLEERSGGRGGVAMTSTAGVWLPPPGR